MRSFGVWVEPRAIELGGVVSAWRGHVDEDECRRTVCRGKMISHATLAKKGNDMLAEVGLKVWLMERYWIVATLHAVNADAGIDLTPVGDVATENCP